MEKAICAGCGQTRFCKVIDDKLICSDCEKVMDMTELEKRQFEIAKKQKDLFNRIYNFFVKLGLPEDNDTKEIVVLAMSGAFLKGEDGLKELEKRFKDLEAKCK